MKLIYINAIKILTFFIFINASTCFSQGWQWAKAQSSNGYEISNKTCTDAAGNVYVAGSFSGVSIQIGTLTPLTNAGVGNNDAFLAKYDANGNALWAQRIGGTQTDNISGVSTDASGNVYITGYFNSALISVVPTSMGNSTSGGGAYDGYIGTFNSSGSCLGLVSFGGLGDQFSSGCFYSNAQSCLYVTGYYGTSTMTIGSNTLTNTSGTGKTDIFISRFTNTGIVTWAKTTGGSNSDDRSSAISADANGFPCIGGVFSPSLVYGTTLIGTTTFTSLGLQDVFLAQYNTLGTFQWAKAAGSNQGGDYMSDIKVDGLNNIYVSGYYQNATFTVGTTSLPNSLGYDAFIAKYNSIGTFSWANKIGGSDNDYGYGIATDANNNVYFTGAFASTVVTIGSTTPATFTLANTNTGSYTDVYVTKYTSAGVTQWAVKPNGTSDEAGYGVTADNVGNIYVVGSFNVAGPTSFGTTTLTSSGLNDGFLAKIGCLNATISGANSVCSGSSLTLTGNGATSYTWSNGAIGLSIIVTPTANVTYSIIGSTGGCVAPSLANFNVTYLTANINAGPDFSLTCGQQQLIPTITNPTSPTSVTWAPTTGLNNSSVLTPTSTSGSIINNYTVTATLSNGCVVKDYINVSSFAPTPQLCMVTVDSLSINNEIYWDKTMYSSIDSFIVYRETSTNVFKRIATLPKTAYSMYTDTARSVGPNNGNPNLASYKYKLQLRDSCGNYSSLSPWHQTIFVQDQQNGNFNWTSYAVEGTTVTPVSNYVLNRRDLTSGLTTTIGATSGNLISDPTYTTFASTNVKWFVDAQGFNCNPTFRINGILANKQKTKSNNSNEKTFPTIGVKENSLTHVDVTVYPNPTKGLLNIKLEMLNGISANSISTIEIKDVFGQVVLNEMLLNQNLSVNISNFSNGIYILNIIQANKIIVVKKIIISK